MTKFQKQLLAALWIYSIIQTNALTLHLTGHLEWYWAVSPTYIPLFILVIIGIYMHETGDLDDLPPFTFKRGWINFKYWIKRKFKK